MSSRQIELHASEWLARLDAGATPQLQQAVAEWRNADPHHEVAFLRMKAAWTRLARLQSLRPASPAVDADVLLPLAPSPGRVQKTRKFLAAAAVVVMLATGALIALSLRTPVYSTLVGGFERVQLPDGSIIELNTDTEIRAHLDKASRNIELLKGEAYFTVARDPTRPFVVKAGDAAVRVLGTAFNVRRHAQGAIEVIVTEGKVTFDAAQPAGTPAPIVTAGQGASMNGGWVQVRELPRPETERELAWQSGMLLFEGDALSEVVGEFNRYNRRQLAVSDATIAPLRIGGYFKATNLDAFVSVLQKDFGVQATVKRNSIVLRNAGRAE